MTTEIETWLTGTFTNDVKRKKKKDVGLRQIRSKCKGLDSKYANLDVDKENQSKLFALTMKRRKASEDGSINSQLTHKNEENDDITVTTFGPIDWESTEVPEPDPVRINIRGSDTLCSNQQSNHDATSHSKQESRASSVGNRGGTSSNRNAAKSLCSDSKFFPIPSSHIESIRKAFGGTHDLCREVFGLNQFSEQQLRIAYFRKGREILQEQRQTKHFKEAKEKFRALTMAFEILSNPQWKNVYDSVMFEEARLKKQKSFNDKHFVNDDVNDDNESKTEQSIGATSLFSNGGCTILSSGSCGSAPILRRSSSWGADRLARSTGTRLRWNEQVEELVFRDHPDERRFKMACDDNGEHPKGEGDSDDRDDDDIENNSDPPQRLSTGKSKGKKSKKVLNAEQLTQEMKNLDLHFEDKMKQRFTKDFLDDFEAGLESIGAKIEGFMRYALSSSETRNPSLEERKQAQAERPNPETYVPENSILASEESSNASTDRTSIAEMVTSYDDVPDIRCSLKKEPHVSNTETLSLDEMVVQKLFDNLVRPPSFDSSRSLSDLLGNSHDIHNKRMEKSTFKPFHSGVVSNSAPNIPSADFPFDDQGVSLSSPAAPTPGDRTVLSSSESDPFLFEPTFRFEVQGVMPYSPDNATPVDGLAPNTPKETPSSELEPALTVHAFRGSRNSGTKHESSSPNDIEGEANPFNKNYNSQGSSTQHPTGLIVKAKIKHRSGKLPDYNTLDDESISALTPGTGKLYRVHSVTSKISGRETILDEESKLSMYGDDDYEIDDKQTKDTFTFNPCTILSVDDALNRTTDATTKGYLRLVRSSSDELFGDEQNIDDSTLTSTRENDLDIPIMDYCQRGEKLVSSQAKASDIGDQSDFVSYLNSWVRDVVADVSSLGCQLNQNLEEARKTIEQSIYIPEEGVEHLLEILEKEIHPGSKFIVEKSFTF